MRNLLIVLMVSLTYFACNAPKQLTSESKEMVFNEQTTKGTKQEIKNKLHIFMNDNFQDSKAVMQSNEDGLLTGQYTTKLKCFDPLCTITVHAEMSFLVKYSDGKYKLKMVLKRIYTFGSSGETTMDYAYWGNYENEVKGKYEAFFLLLKNFMKSDQSEF